MTTLLLGLIPRVLTRGQAAECCGCETLGAFDGAAITPRQGKSGRQVGIPGTAAPPDALVEDKH